MPQQERKLSIKTRFIEGKQKTGKMLVKGTNQVEGPCEQDFKIEEIATENFELLAYPSDEMKT